MTLLDENYELKNLIYFLDIRAHHLVDCDSVFPIFSHVPKALKQV